MTVESLLKVIEEGMTVILKTEKIESQSNLNVVMILKLSVAVSFTEK